MPKFTPWANTDFYCSRCNWLAIPKSRNLGIEGGQTDSSAFRSTPEDPQIYKLWLPFKTKFNVIPRVHCWVTKYDLECGRPPEMYTWVESMQRDGAWLVAKLGDNVHVYDLRVSWIAYDEGQRVIWTDRGDCGFNGKACTGGGGRRLNDPHPGRFFGFPDGMFEKPPTICVMLSSIHFDKRANARVDVITDALTKDGVWVGANTWGDTILNHAEVVVVAIG